MDLYDKVSDLAKRRGIMFPSFEIYGGLSGFIDYGPLGTLLKKNIENKWREIFIYKEGMVELESTIIMSEQVFKASGHLTHFTDLMTKCKNCGYSYRADELLKELGVICKESMTSKEIDIIIEKENIRCPRCKGIFSKVEPFNLMFKVNIGSYTEGVTGYGRPEAGQGQFLNFKRIYLAERERLPLGIAQVGRCLRNEISPRKGPIRLREFTIIDYEIFFDPENASYPRINLVENIKLPLLLADNQKSGKKDTIEITVQEALKRGIVKNEILCYFMALAVKFMEILGIPYNKQRFREVLPEERAHYSDQTFDQEVYLERWGWTEIAGHAYRTDYDLRNHMAHSGVDLVVYKKFKEPKEVEDIKIEPVIETLEESFGKERIKNILTLISKTPSSIIEREITNKGFYDITGDQVIRLEKKHVRIFREKSILPGRYFLPHVVEPSFGIDRIFYATLEYAYSEKNDRILLKLPRDISAIKIAVLPLVSKDKLPDKAKEVYQILLDENYISEYDASGSIGKRYARADEAGIPICITIDYKSLEDNTVTLRDIYTWKQVRVKIKDLPNILNDYFRYKINFDKIGDSFK